MRRSMILWVVILNWLPAGASVNVQNQWSCQCSNGPVRDFGEGFQSASGVSWLSVPGSLVLEAAPLRHGMDLIPGGVSDIVCGDFDLDGSMDIAVCQFRGSVFIYGNTGSGVSFGKRQVFLPSGAGPERMSPGDIDADGDTDLVCTSRAGSSMGWLENRGSSPWEYHLLAPGPGVPFPLDAGDVDGDGDIDILVGLDSPGRLVCLENLLPEGEWAIHEVDDDIPYPYWVSILPWENGLIASSYDDSVCYMYRRSGDGWNRQLIMEIPGPLCAIPAVTGQGNDLDLFLCSSHDDAVYRWGIGGGDISLISDEMIAPSFLCAADLDRDGDMDLLGSSEAAGELIRWEKTGPGDSFAPHDAGAVTGVSCCSAGDMDGDGLLDAAAGSLTDGSVEWISLFDHVERGTLVSSVLYIGPVHGDLSVEWFGSEPLGTSVSLEVRMSGDRRRMGEWLDAGPGSDLSLFLTPSTRFLQYRLELRTTDSAATPRVDSVRVEVLPPIAI